jgi:hypothetical protein
MLRATGKVQDKKLVFNSKIDFSSLEGKPVVIKIEEWKPYRSQNQNRYLWGVVYAEISSFTGMSVEEVHEGMKHLFLVDRENKIPKVKSTTELTTKQFIEFVDKVREFAIFNLGIQIPEPNDHRFLYEK